MLVRLSVLLIMAAQLMLFASGCEQIKEYRKKAYYEKALQLYEAQDYRAALEQLGYALEFDQDYLDALILRGVCQYELKNFEDAGFTLEHALRIDESRDDVALKAADALYRRGRFFRALARTERLLETQPGNPVVLLLDARIRLRSRALRWWVGVESRLQPLLDNDAYRHAAFALLAEFQILNDNLESAERMLMEYAHPGEDWFFVMRMLAQRYEALDDYPSAERMYRKILEIQPDSASDIQRLLALLRSEGRMEAELQLIDSLPAADTAPMQRSLALIEVYMHYGLYAEAEKHIRTGLGYTENQLDFSRHLIELYKNTERYAEAIQAVKEVLEMVEGQMQLEVEFMYFLARLYYTTNNPEMTRFVVRWILALDRNHRGARFLLARLSLDEGRSLLAIAELRALASEDADNPDYDYYTGLAHMARSEVSNAEQSFNEALRKDPAHKPALLRIAAIYLEKGFLVDVENMINDFEAIDPDDTDVAVLREQLAEKIAAGDD